MENTKNIMAMVIIFTITFVLLIVILIKRQILRMLLISKRGPHTTVGTGAPQTLAREIELRLRKIARLRIEPRMMAEQFNKSSEDSNGFDSPPDQYARSYKYRLKAMDKMTELDDLICSINNKYGRRKGQSVKGYLRMLQKHPFNVIKGGNDTIDKLAEMYEHARYEPKEFGSPQYRKFAYLVEQMKDRVRLYINVPGSLIINTSSKQPKKPPLSSTKVATQSTDIKPDDAGENKEESPKDSPTKYAENEPIDLQEIDQEEDIEETDDVNQPLLTKQPYNEVAAEHSEQIETVVVVHGDGVKETTTSGKNEETL